MTNKKHLKKVSRKKQTNKSKTCKRTNKSKTCKQTNKKYGGNGRLNFYDYLTSNKDDDDILFLTIWYDELKPFEQDILNNTFLENNNEIHLENGCFLLGKGSFGVVYLNSPKKKKKTPNFKTEWEEKQNEYLEWREKKRINKSIYGNVIKVIQNNKKIDNNNFFEENIKELFFVKKVVNHHLGNPEPLHVVDIQHFLIDFDFDKSTLFFVMERFEFTLTELISKKKNIIQKGGVLINQNGVLESVFNARIGEIPTEKCLETKIHDNNSLLDELKNTFQFKKQIMIQIIQGLIQIHDAEVVHCDLKPDNIFINMDNSDFLQVCIADFGTAKNYDDIEQVTGTPLYMSPEYLLNFYKREPVYQKFFYDIYSLGIICFGLFSPFKTWINFFQNNEEILKQKIITGEYLNDITNFFDKQNDIPVSVKIFILNCVNPDSSIRPSANQCLEMVNKWTE